MKLTTLLSAVPLMTAPLFAADASAKDEVAKAAQTLAGQANYSWRTTVEVPEDAPFRPGPTEGKTQKDGVTYVTMSFGEFTTHAAIQGEKAAVTNPNGDWQSVAALENEEGPGRLLALFVRNILTPAEQAAELVSHVKDLKKDGDTYSGELTEEGAKTLMRFRRRGGDGGPAILSAKASVKFWLKDGALQKFEHQVEGSMDFNGNTFDVKRTTTTVIKDVGTTKIELPEGAKKLLS
jgi:hypothetical protein